MTVVSKNIRCGTKRKFFKMAFADRRSVCNFVYRKIVCSDIDKIKEQLNALQRKSAQNRYELSVLLSYFFFFLTLSLAKTEICLFVGPFTSVIAGLTVINRLRY